MKLYDLNKGDKIYADGISDGSEYIIFGHPDGMYSYNETQKGRIIHLKITAPVEKFNDGYKLLYLEEEDDGNKSNKQKKS